MRLVAIVCLFALTLVACGTRGPLYLPPDGAEDAQPKQKRR